MSMLASCFVWNVRGLNGRARRNVVQALGPGAGHSHLYSGDKLSVVCNSLAIEILGQAFDYDYLPALNVSGGILLGWDRELWTVSDVTKGRFTLSAKIAEKGPLHNPWWITVVYGP